MANSTMKDWDLPDTPDTNHPSTTAEHTENWDDDFESRDAQQKRDQLDRNANVGRRDEEDRTVTARLRCAAPS